MEEPQNQHQPMGRGMLTVAWVLVLAALAWIFGNWEEKQYNPNQELRSSTNSEFAEVTLSGNRMHHYVATGSINGVEAVFLLDTGATDVVVPKELAEEIGLHFGVRGYAQTANGTVDIWSTSLDRVELGSIQLHNIRASINPAMYGNEVLLGMSALRHLEITQKDNQLTLRQAR